MVFTSITIINCITEIIVTDYTATLTPVAAPSVLPAENCCINPWAGSLTRKVLACCLGQHLRPMQMRQHERPNSCTC